MSKVDKAFEEWLQGLMLPRMETELSRLSINALYVAFISGWKARKQSKRNND